MAATVLDMRHVDLYRDTAQVLSGVDWRVHEGERWIVLGPNGCGKTTLLSLASGYLHPSRGSVTVLGQALGRTDVRALRRRVALVSAAIGHMVLPQLSARELVLSGARAALEPWWHTYQPDEVSRADELLEEAGFAHIAGRPFGHLSEGERQQVLLCRALMSTPDLLLLDEPCAGLDMGGRERLLESLSRLASRPGSPATVMVTHHVEEIPRGFTHLLLVKAGVVQAAGRLGEVLTEESLSSCFGLRLALDHHGGRWASRSR